MKKTIVYIDGTNLYYGQLRGTHNKWLDLLALFYRNIPHGFAEGCLLPESFKTTEGRTISRPPAWA